MRKYLIDDKITYESLLKSGLIQPCQENRSAISAYGKNLNALARNSFKDHQLMSESGDRWTIAAKDKTGRWTSIYLTDIIILRMGVFVCGDIDPVIFEGGGRDTPRGLLDWVRTSQIEGYLDTKASIGFRASASRNPAETDDNDVAIAEMKDRLFECFETLCEETIPDAIEYFKAGLLEDPEKPATAQFNVKTARIECENEQLLEKIIWTINTRLETDEEIHAWVKAIDRVQWGEALELVKNGLYDDLHEAGVGDVGELACNIGVVPAPRLYYAQEACRKLCELLEAKEDAKAEAQNA